MSGTIARRPGRALFVVADDCNATREYRDAFRFDGSAFCAVEAYVEADTIDRCRVCWLVDINRPDHTTSFDNDEIAVTPIIA